MCVKQLAWPWRILSLPLACFQSLNPALVKARGRNYVRTSVNFRAFNWNDRPQIQMVGHYDRAHYLVSSSGLVNPQRACASEYASCFVFMSAFNIGSVRE